MTYKQFLVAISLWMSFLLCKCPIADRSSTPCLTIWWVDNPAWANFVKCCFKFPWETYGYMNIGDEPSHVIAQGLKWKVVQINQNVYQIKKSTSNTYEDIFSLFRRFYYCRNITFKNMGWPAQAIFSYFVLGVFIVEEMSILILS